MDFITIDFETATHNRDSPCEVGISIVVNNQITEVKSWLIKPYYYPYFDNFNVALHGITPEAVKDSPEFVELWQAEIKPLIDGQFVIAHNAGFDMSVLRKTLELYNQPFPDIEYSCSYIFSKKVWQGLPSYDLSTLCWHNNIPLVHHRAGSDSEATAKLALKAFEQAEISSKEEINEKLKISIGKLFQGGYNPAKTQKISIDDIKGDSEKQNPESLFYGKTVMFTGTLMSMPRKEAQQLISDIGGINGKGVTKDTDFLIVGQQDYRVVGDAGMSSKQERAMQLVQKGAALEILSEDEFLRSL